VTITRAVQLDLGVGDVHTPSSGGLVFGQTNDRPSARTPGQHAAFCVVRNQDGEVLCVSRPEPPYEMSIPGGMVEDGETPEAAAARELKEETGVRATALKHLRDLVSPTDGRPCHFFEATAWDGNAYDAEPDSKVEWLLPSALFSQAVLYRATVSELLKHGDLHDPTHGNSRTMADQINLADVAAKPDALTGPLDTAARTRKASSKLERMKKMGKVSDGDYKSAKALITAAAKKFAVSADDASAPSGRRNKPRSLHIRADIASGGSLHVRHMRDGTDMVYLPLVRLTAD